MVNEAAFQQLIGGFAKKYRNERKPIDVVDTTKINRSTLESIATTTFTASDYDMNVTVGSEYEELETGVEVRQDLPDVGTHIALGDVLHQIMLREEHEKLESKVRVNVQVLPDEIRGSIYMPQRTMQTYTEAAHFLKKVLSTYGSDPKLTLPQLFDIGYTHIGGTGYEAPEGYAVDFIFRPELTRLTLRVGDDDVPLKTTEVLDGNGFQVKRTNDYMTCVEYSRNPLREQLELPTNPKCMGLEESFIEYKN